ncbi:KH domain-containing protein [Candidatus Saccharibacteria bacterium]|nr:KH domain-containing protein [Candidatus Saccharibacteria bacterium]
MDQQFVEFIVKSLVGNPDGVSVARSVDEKGVLLELTVDPEDLGRVIGKRGATAQSLRTLLRALGTKNDARYNLKIVDTSNGDSNSSRPVSSSNDSSTEVEDEAPDDVEQAESDVVSKTRKELDDLDDLDI